MVEGVAARGRSWDSIREEEGAYVRETIEKARQARERNARRHRTLLGALAAWGAWLILGPLVWLAVYIHYWQKIGRDYRFPDAPEYYREAPSNLSPALVQVLMREGRDITPRSFTATIFDLARRGYLEIEDRSVEKKTLLGKKNDTETFLTCRPGRSKRSGTPAA